MRTVVAGLFLATVALAVFWDGPNPSRAPGIVVPWEPDQDELAQPLSWNYHGARIEALARYRIRGRVLFTTRYWWGRDAELSPIDLTLGWRPMSDQSVLDLLDLYHLRRGFSFRFKGRKPAFTWEEINEHSANTHMVPATDKIAAQLAGIARGDLVDLHGYLIEAVGKDGWHWKSSLSRADSGEGACELMWVEGLAKM
jgi:hypothetical protein